MGCRNISSILIGVGRRQPRGWSTPNGVHRSFQLLAVLGGATAGVPPHVMGSAQRLSRTSSWRGLVTQADIDVIEFNEAFVAQELATLHYLKIADDNLPLNPNGRAVALDHPLGCQAHALLAR